MVIAVSIVRTLSNQAVVVKNLIGGVTYSEGRAATATVNKLQDGRNNALAPA